MRPGRDWVEPATPAKGPALLRLLSRSCWVWLEASGRFRHIALPLPDLTPFSHQLVSPLHAEITIVKRPDGSDWCLGSGGFGRVGYPWRGRAGGRLLPFRPIPAG